MDSQWRMGLAPARVDYRCQQKTVAMLLAQVPMTGRSHIKRSVRQAAGGLAKDPSFACEKMNEGDPAIKIPRAVCRLNISMLLGVN